MHKGREHAARMLREGGYARHKDGDIHADAAADKKMVVKAVHQHDQQLHHGKHTHLKLRGGGKVHGKEAECRPDRRARGGEIGVTHGLKAEKHEETVGEWAPAERRAAGGHIGKKAKHSKVIVNVHAAPEGDPQREQQAHQMGMQQGARMGAQAAMQRMAGAGGGGGPPAGQMRPPGGMAGGPPPGGAPGGPMPGGGAPPGAGMAPRPMPPGAGAPGPMMASGGAMRDRLGRFTGGAVT